MENKNLGTVTMTAAIGELTEENEGFKAFVQSCFDRYVSNSWGDMSIADCAQNDKAVQSGNERIFASYPFPESATWHAISGFDTQENKLWIITESDHRVTTILFPSEY